MFESGFFTALRLRGVPVRVHWTLFVGAAFVSGLRFAPGVWLGFILLVLFHEVGHTVLVWRARATVREIRLTGIGGECHYEGPVSPLARSVIAWGGVLAQLALLGLTYGLLSLGWIPTNPILGQLLGVWLEPNLVIILLNLLPFAPLDGAEAWKLFGRLRRRPVRRVAPAVRVRVGDREVDEHVATTVREALERARREAREGRERQG